MANIHQAAIEGNAGLVRQQLKDGVPPDERDENQYTASMYAAQFGNDKAFKALMEAGADPEAAIPSGPNVLAFAIMGNRTSIVQALLDQGVNVNTRGDYHPKVLPHHPSPLMDAVVMRKRKVMELLIAAGADVNFRQTTGHTALSLALESKNKSLARLLEEAGATGREVEPVTLNPAEDIFEAARVGDVAALRGLVDEGVPVDARDGAGRTSLTLAAQHGREEAFRYLWDAGADPNATKVGGPDVLECAVGSDSENIVCFLLEHGYPVDGADNTSTGFGGFTPLMAAAVNGNVRLVQMLLDAGANPNIKHVTETALSFARQQGHKEVTDLLKAGGAIGKDPALAAMKELAQAAEREEFKQVIQHLTKTCQCEPKPARRKGVWRFSLPKEGFAALAEHYGQGQDYLKGIDAERRLERRAELLWLLNEEVRREGFLLINSQPEPSGKLLLFPTADPYVVLAARGSNGANHGLTTSDVIRWLRDMEKTHPFVLTGCGHDFLSGRFLDPVADALPLAKRMVELCPDLLDGDVLDSADALADELAASQELFFWWD